RVGCDLSQSQEEMFKIARKLGIEPIRVDEYLTGQEGTPVIISSTKIRESLLKGDIESANLMLGYRYGLEGVVVEGQRIGRTIGFPTANIMLYEPLKLLPADGVYAVWAESLGRCYKGITNIGTRPTISHMNERTIETHILGFDEDIYGLSFKIEFVKRLRNEQKFASLHELKLQLERDRLNAKEILTSGFEQLR
ncbi:MAG: riboflavin kinase, partial [Bacteroidales bacterium]|nr:riboflavin kinase [Bacteroidales bacterium]